MDIIIAGKYEDQEMKRHLEEDAGQKCRFGFNWWYWMPRIRTGRVNITLAWLCFMFDYYRGSTV